MPSVQLYALSVKGRPAPTAQQCQSVFSRAAAYWVRTAGQTLTAAPDVRQLKLETGISWGSFENINTVSVASTPADIRIYIRDTAGGGHSFTARDAPGKGQVYADGDWRDLAHELGHVFGLEHSMGVIAGLGLSAYANPYSMMGGGSGVPDGTQLALLGRGTPTVCNTVTPYYLLRPVSRYGAAGHSTLTWTQGGSTYATDYRSCGTAAGLDPVPEDPSEPARCLTVYRVDGKGGTILAKQIPVGKSYRVGGRWVELQKCTPTAARVRIT